MEERTAAVAPEPARHGTETILLVEDEEALRELVASMLRERGHTVLEADCGRTALAVADGHPGVIDLLLSDVVMPGMNGRQVAREITLRRPAIKVVFMSGYSDEALGRSRHPRSRHDPAREAVHRPPPSTAASARCWAIRRRWPPGVETSASEAAASR